MSKAPSPATSAPMILPALTAAELMTPNPVSIRDTATVAEALALLTDRGLGAAPVIDEAGHAVGVLSQTDLLIHERGVREKALAAAAGPADPARVRDVMTPGIFSAAPHATARSVVEQLLALKVHRLFVVDEHGVIVGVIRVEDVLRQLRLADDLPPP